MVGWSEFESLVPFLMMINGDSGLIINRFLSLVAVKPFPVLSSSDHC